MMRPLKLYNKTLQWLINSNISTFLSHIMIRVSGNLCSHCYIALLFSKCSNKDNQILRFVFEILLSFPLFNMMFNFLRYHSFLKTLEWFILNFRYFSVIK